MFSHYRLKSYNLGKTEAVEQAKSSEMVNPKSKPLVESNDDQPLTIRRVWPKVVSKTVNPEPNPFVDTDTDEDDDYHVITKSMVRPRASAKHAAGGASSLVARAAAPEARVIKSSGKRRLAVRLYDLDHKVITEIEDTTARQAQMQMCEFSSTVTELCTGFETSKKKNDELGKQVTDLKGQIQKWKDQKTSWDEKKKELERERDEARKEVLKAVSEKHDLEEKLKKAAKQAEDAKASAKKATECYKIGLGNFVASLANTEGKTLEDYVNELVKEMLRDDKAQADGAVDVTGRT